MTEKIRYGVDEVLLLILIGWKHRGFDLHLVKCTVVDTEIIQSAAKVPIGGGL